jgi:hypothetical protein
LSGRVTTTRRRKLPSSLPNSASLRIKTVYPDGTLDVQDYSSDLSGHARTLTGSQITVSENHPGWKDIKKGVQSSDEGGPFLMQRRYVEGPLGSTSFHVHKTDSPIRFATTDFFYNGPMLPTNGIVVGDKWPPYFQSGASQLDAYGTTAIARCKPANNIASLAETLLELRRDGIPKLVGAGLWKAKTRTQLQRASGDELLNIEFGYKPLASDIANAAAVIYDADRLIKQYKRDAGKVVRRRFAFPPIIEDSYQVIGSNTNAGLLGPTSTGLIDWDNFSKGEVVLRQTRERRVWFSGAFTYFLPVDPKLLGEIDARSGPLKKLLGLEISPETLWNLAPWSWAVDWVSNTGDVISNLQSWTRDGMVLHYGYVMEHTIARDTYVYVGPSGWATSTKPPVVTLVSETKQRRGATPFGFGLKYGEFSDRQKAIITALGLSRSRD